MLAGNPAGSLSKGETEFCKNKRTTAKAYSYTEITPIIQLLKERMILMKKIKILAVVTVSLLVAVIGIFVVLAVLGVLRIERDENGGKAEIIFSPINKKENAIVWQTTETEGDKVAVIETEHGNI